jgi:hypothetical protein
VTALPAQLQRLHQEIYARKFRVKVNDHLTLSTTATAEISVAKFSMGEQRINFTVEELRYLRDIFYSFQNQLHYYIVALPDLLKYADQVLSSTECYT